VILKNNYETLSYTKGMRTVLDINKLPLNPSAQNTFNTQLVKQEHNITEKGEREATAQVRRDLGILQSSAASLADQENAVYDARNALRRIEDLNMAAIEQKTSAAQESVNNAVLILGIVGCFTFLVLFSFSVNIAGFIADPLIKITEGLAEMGQFNYDHRLHFHKNKEFEEVSHAFNLMAVRLQERENNDLTHIFAEKRRLETVVEQIQEAVIITNEKNDVIFINTAAKHLFHLHEHRPGNVPTEKLAAANRWLRTVFSHKNDDGWLKLAMNGGETLLKLESTDIYVPNMSSLRTDEVNIARLSAGKVFLIRNVGEMHGA
jgi:nitrogen fixation/metabolism regulation signal transduction histidine kinase